MNMDPVRDSEIPLDELGPLVASDVRGTNSLKPPRNLSRKYLHGFSIFEMAREVLELNHPLLSN